MKRLSLNFETVGSLVAMVIGLSALFVAWDQAQIMRKQQHASVIPIVNISGGFETVPSGNVMRIAMENDGIGPAIVEATDLIVQAEPLRDWQDLQARLLPERLRTGYQTRFEGAVGILAPGEKLTVIELRWERSPEIDQAFLDFQSAVFKILGPENGFVACYCSVFDRCWRTNSIGRARPEPVSQCESEKGDIVTKLLSTIKFDEITAAAPIGDGTE